VPARHTSSSLVFSAGPAALAEIRQHGFDPARIGTLAGASGGAKWLVLSQLDRVIARRILPRLVAPVHTIGTSIGAWRFACYAQSDPVAAIDRFEEAYLSQAYSDRPDRAEITAKSREILDVVFDGLGVSEVLRHPVLRMHVMAVRCRNLLVSDRRAVLAAGLVASATANLASRKLLGGFFERVLFYDRRDPPPFFDLPGFPMHQVPLREDNVKDVILATGSIPLVLEGVRDIAGARPGVYRDGGVIDYHLDFPHASDDRLALYPHFYDFLKPGWFDKPLSWRRPRPTSIDRSIVVSPSPAFVDRLPHGKIPDRHDFERFEPAQRERDWRTAVDLCREMADEFEDVLENDRLAERIRPLDL